MEYTAPEIEIIYFENEDVIVVSGGDSGNSIMLDESFFGDIDDE